MFGAWLRPNFAFESRSFWNLLRLVVSFCFCSVQSESLLVTLCLATKDGVVWSTHCPLFLSIKRPQARPRFSLPPTFFVFDYTEIERERERERERDSSMERGNYGRGRGRDGGGGRRGGRGRFGGGGGRDQQQQHQYYQQQSQYHQHNQGGGGGRGGRDQQQHQHYQQQGQYNQYNQGGGGRGTGGRGGVGRGLSYAAASAVQPPQPPAQQWGPPRPYGSAGESSARGAWGPGPRAWRPATPPAPALPDRAPEPPATPPAPALPDRAPEPPSTDFQSPKISEHPSASSLPRTPGSDLQPVKRPDGGGRHSIQPLKLLANHFRVNFNPNTIITHYDVDVKQEVPPDGHSAKIRKSDLTMIKDKLFSDDPSRFPLSMTAYDGEKNIFSAVPLPEGKFQVDFSDAEDKKTKSYIFTIKAVNSLQFCKLRDYLSTDSHGRSVPRDILQGMDLVMKENPSRHRISVGRNFYPKAFNNEDDLDGGITASKGFQQGLKPTSQGLALCLDYSVLSFHKWLPVIDFLKEHIRGFREANDVKRLRNQVSDSLEGLKVTVTHRKTKQKYTIKRLTEKDTRNISFGLEDRDQEGKVSVKDINLVAYFKEKYAKEIIHKDIPCLDLGTAGKINYVPMEFCVLVEGQRYAKENLSRDGSLLLKNMSLAPPRERMNTICEMVRAEDGPCGGGIAQNFGLQVIQSMSRVEGRVINPPQLKVGGPNGILSVDREKRQWNLVGKSVVEGKPVERWALIDFSCSKYSRLNIDHFVQSLRSRCQKLGIRMEEPLVCRQTNMRPFSDINMLRDVLYDVVTEGATRCQGRLQIIVCVMAGVDPGYKFLKWLSETQIGVVTQCCLSKHASQARDQYLANLALKINAKLGGSNTELVDPLPRFEGEGHVMFVGADVNHPPASNKTCPSMAAVVATVNWPAANRYAARICPQFHRKEHILNFGSMCLELIQTYARINKVKPRRIVIFRDGVSEGQFDMVLNEELRDLKKAIYAEDYHPTITVIVARKRHQTRLFPETPRDGGPTGNVPPGTVVDRTITHPFEFDFYLCSHYGILGTSKPTHYYVLWDEHNFTSDQLQKLIYDMCFTFARCTKPVSLVPPVYYADLVAYRGRMFQEVVTTFNPGSAAASSSSSSVASSSGPSFDEGFYKLHPELENIMYFV
ncbi:protein argonaute 2-like [Diospyros lotus]|uniref:protein argonaute 2-like n=1 Tax=Diospyros lotus TaxID=55363 RepID=UPI002252157D|nr:protein argonaute 2-like [Diospyros lotus]